MAFFTISNDIKVQGGTLHSFLTTKQVADRYNVHVRTVQRWIHAKRLKAVKLGGNEYRVREIDLLDLENRAANLEKGRAK